MRLGANACIIGRNVEKTEEAAKDIATCRPGAKVIGIGGCDVRKVSFLIQFQGCVITRRGTMGHNHCCVVILGFFFGLSLSSFSFYQLA